MDYYLIFTLIVSVVFLFAYHALLSANRYEFFQNILPELFGIFITYEIIEYVISRRKKREDQRRLKNLYRQIRSELIMILQNLRQIANHVKYVDENFYGWARDNKSRIKIIYPVLIAGNDLFTEYFYATLFRVVRDIEKSMDYILETYPDKTITRFQEADIELFILKHNELANFIMTSEYEEIPEDIQLIGEQSV